MAKDDGPPETVEEKPAAPILRAFASVFMHADAVDVVLMVLGLAGAMGDGMSTPVMLAITSRVFDDTGSGPDHLQQFSSKMNAVQIPS
jgi:ATP-binding cassette subfamily B (MDR/TAP) protein 1